MGELSIRPVVGDDLDFLDAMLYEAAFWRPAAGRDRPPLDAVRDRPEFALYVAGWGRAGDRGLVAWDATTRCGAAWSRLYDDDTHGYGYVDPHTPELAMAVVGARRGHGIGATLLTALLAQAALDGHAGLSLSVETDNPAHRLYERVGFRPVTESDGAWTMVAALAAGRR